MDKVSETERTVLKILETDETAHIGNLSEFQAEEIAIKNSLLFRKDLRDGFHVFWKAPKIIFGKIDITNLTYGNLQYK